jgi:hypothetical protein
MNKFIFNTFFLLMLCSAASAQKWVAGRFTDMKGNTETGFIRINPSAKGPAKDEGFIEFRENDKSNPFKLSAGELKSFVAGRDSFVVAHAPGNEQWAKRELDFVKVAVDEDIKIYMAGSAGTGKGGSGFGFSPGVGIGAGTGGYGGAGVGVGATIPIFGGGDGGNEKTAWYYGENTAAMKRLTNENFEDVMSDIMGDYPEVVDKIHAKVYMLANVDRLINYFKQVKGAKK